MNTCHNDTNNFVIDVLQRSMSQCCFCRSLVKEDELTALSCNVIRLWFEATVVACVAMETGLCTRHLCGVLLQDKRRQACCLTLACDSVRVCVMLLP